MNKRSLLKKTSMISSMTLTSRFLGVVREMLLLKFFGLGVHSDAFLTAWRLPNFFRKIFAEGAMSAAFIPVFVKLVRQGKGDVANGLMTLAFIFFQGILLCLCFGVITYPELIVNTIAPGFSGEQIAYTIPLLQILFPYIFFISSSALLAGALQSVHHFFIPAFSQPLTNIFWITFLIICIRFHFSALVLSAGILLAGLAQLVLHLFMYVRKGFTFGGVNVPVREAFKVVLTKFVPCLLGASVMEINLFLDTVIASYLAAGSMSILNYGNRFMQIPLGIFAIALSTTLLPHFSRVILYAPKRIEFYLLEVAKLVTFVIVPAMFFLTVNAYKLFYLFLMGKHGSVEHVPVASVILMIYVTGLLFFCMNKVLTSVFYAYGDTWTPSVGFALSSVVNFIGNLIGMYFYGIYGIAGSTVVSGISLSVFFLVSLWYRHSTRFYFIRFFTFFVRYLLLGTLGAVVYYLLHVYVFSHVATWSWAHFFLWKYGYWLIEFPLFGLVFFGMYQSRGVFGLRLYFVDG